MAERMAPIADFRLWVLGRPYKLARLEPFRHMESGTFLALGRIFRTTLYSLSFCNRGWYYFIRLPLDLGR